MNEEQLLARITVDPEMCFGKPCIRGMRYPVIFILELMSSGMTQEEILAEYDKLEAADLQAVAAYAVRALARERAQQAAA